MHKDDGVSEKKKGTKKPIPKTSEERKSWDEQQKDLDRKLQELLYEDRNGFRPPRPWYEDDNGSSAIGLSQERFTDFHSKKKRFMQQAQL